MFTQRERPYVNFSTCQEVCMQEAITLRKFVAISKNSSRQFLIQTKQKMLLFMACFLYIVSSFSIFLFLPFKFCRIIIVCSTDCFHIKEVYQIRIALTLN